jgi:hypothetical protein
MDKTKAVTAAAHKLARLIYSMRPRASSTPIKVRPTTKSAIGSACCTTSTGARCSWA